MPLVTSGEVLCIGEILWDSLPAGLYLGGAPFNVAAHLQLLGVPAGLVSRVGNDRLGAEAVARALRLGVATDLIQIDPALPTGFVTVDVDEAGSPDYEILRPVAWDSLEATDAALERSARARAVVFGSLAQRSASARDTIRRLSAAATFRVFDVNLRIPYDDPGIVRRSLEGADLVKLNQQELTTLSGWLGLPTGVREAARAIAESFGTGVVCVTRGADGAALLRDGRWSEHAGFPVEVADTVGAGDAFLAALLQGLLTGEDDAVTLDRACLLGSFVASRRGALPKHEQEELARLAERRRVWDHVEGRSPAMRAE